MNPVKWYEEAYWLLAGTVPGGTFPAMAGKSFSQARLPTVPELMAGSAASAVMHHVLRKMFPAFMEAADYHMIRQIIDVKAYDKLPAKGSAASAFRLPLTKKVKVPLKLVGWLMWADMGYSLYHYSATQPWVVQSNVMKYDAINSILNDIFDWEIGMLSED